MRTGIGCLLMIAGVALGVYVGVWWAFIGGIVQVVEQIRAPELSAITLAIGVAKIVFSGFLGWVSCVILLFPGYAMAK